MWHRTLGRHLLDLLFPLRCAGCAAFDTALCDRCRARLVPARGPGRCANCCAAWAGDGFCPRCFHLRDLAGIRAAYEHEGAARALVHRLKYERYRALVPLMAAELRPLAAAIPVVAWVPVPLHPARERERGFNQAALLLRALELPQAPVELRRVRNTGSQVGRTAAARDRALANAFACSGPPLDGAPVGLLDDVITSGATVRACARVLRDHGAGAIWALSFTRASYTLEPNAPIPH